MRRQTSTAAAGTPRSRRHDARASRASGERAGGARKRTTATATPRQKGGDATATVTPSSSSSSSSYYSPTVASGYSSMHLTPASVPRGSSYTPGGVTSHLGTTSPAALMARSVAAGLRGSRARELHDAKEEEVHALRAKNQLLEQRLIQEQKQHSTPALAHSSSPPSALDSLLATAHQVRSIQEKELAYASTPTTSDHARGSVQSLLTSLARDRDDAKAASQKMGEAAHELRLEVSKVSGQLAVSMSDKERLESDLRAMTKRAEGLDSALRASEREGIVRQAEIHTQRDETHSLRREVAQLRDALHEANSASQAARLERDALSEQCAALETEKASLEGSVELGVQEAAALRDSMSQLTADVEAARSDAASKEAALQRRAAEMDMLSADIARTKERLQGEQREHGEAEAALQELLGEVRQLSGEKDREKASRSAAELEAEAKDRQLAELKARLQQAEAAKAELEAALVREVDARTGCEEGLRAATRLHEEDARKRLEAERDAANLREAADERTSAVMFAKDAERRLHEAVERADSEQKRADRVASEAAATLAAETQRWGDRLEASQEEARKCREDTQLTTHALKEEVQRQQTRLRSLEREVQSRGAEMKVQESEIRRLTLATERAQSMHEKSRTKVSELQDALRRAIAAAREANGRVATLRSDLEDKVRDFAVVTEQLARAKADAQRAHRDVKAEKRKCRDVESRVSALEEDLETSEMAKMGLEGKLRSQERQSRATHTRLLQELEALKGSYHQFIELSKAAGRDMSVGTAPRMNPLAYSMVTRPSIGSPPRDNSSGVFDGRAAAAGEGGGVFYNSAHNGDVVDRIARELRRGGIGVGGGGDIKITKGDDGSVNLHLGRR